MWIGAGRVLLEGRGILEEVLAVVLEGCGILEGALSVMEGCGIFGECFGDVTFWKRRLQSFGGVWHFWRALAVLWRGVAFLEGTCSVCLQYFGSA